MKTKMNYAFRVMIIFISSLLCTVVFAARKNPGKAVEKTALVIVDIQNDYFPGGKLVLENSIPASIKAGSLLEFFRKNNGMVIHVQHEMLSGTPDFFQPGTNGILIHKNVAPVKGETIITKHYPDSFQDTGLLEILKKNGITKIILVGMQTNVCVQSTAQSAKNYEYELVIAGDATAAKNEDLRVSTLEMLGRDYGKVVLADDILNMK